MYSYISGNLRKFSHHEEDIFSFICTYAFPHFWQCYALICIPVKENNYFYVAIITIREFRENASIKLIILCAKSEDIESF
jgi:hypothetical protein